MVELLADTYALFGLLEGNPRYRALFAHENVVTTALNVVEVYAVLLRRVEKEKAREFADSCLALAVDVPGGVALPAGEFRAQRAAAKKNCSHIDAWGYAAARALGRKFLTGDEAFRGLSNVMFVK